MKLYLLRYYARPILGFADYRGFAMLGLVLPVVVMNAWIFSNASSVWTAVVLSILGVLVVPQRATAFEAAMPISGRDIAMVRSIAAFTAQVVPAVTAALIIKLVHGTAFPLLQLAQAITLIALAVLLPRLVRPREYTVAPVDTLYPLIPVGVIAASAIVYLGDRIALAILVVAAAIAAFRWWRVVPHTFEIAPRAVAGRETADESVATSQRANQIHWSTIVVTTLWTKNRALMLALMFLMGASGIWEFYVVAMFLFVEELWQRPRWLQSLPLSHRTRLWMVLVPAVFAPMTAVFVGTQIHVPGWDDMQGPTRGGIETNMQEPHYYNSPTTASLEYWERATDTVPQITSPWGEKTDPYVLRVFNRVYYNPYTSRKASSEQFTAWQYQRLTKIMYGTPLELRKFENGERFPRRTTQSLRMTVLNLSASLLLAFVFLIVTGIARWRGSWRQTKMAHAFHSLVILVPTLLFLCVSLIYAFQQGSHDRHNTTARTPNHESFIRVARQHRSGLSRCSRACRNPLRHPRMAIQELRNN